MLLCAENALERFLTEFLSAERSREKHEGLQLAFVKENKPQKLLVLEMKMGLVQIKLLVSSETATSTVRLGLTFRNKMTSLSSQFLQGE